MSNESISQSVAGKSDTKRWRPVTEALLGVCFVPKPALTMAEIGQFWGRFKKDYPNSATAGLVPVIERGFEADRPDQIGVYEIPQPTARLQFIDETGSNMHQVQNGWLLSNWLLRPQSEYCGYPALLSKFKTLWTEFEDFYASELKLQDGPELIFCEVTYVNTIGPGGKVYKDADDVWKVFPGLIQNYGDDFKTVNIASHLFLQYKTTPLELHISVTTPLINGGDGRPPQQAASIQLQTRSPLPRKGKWNDIEAQLKLSHDVANDRIFNWLSKDARVRWESEE